MKTSNKLLLGLLALVVIGLIAVNIVLKKQVEARHNLNNQQIQTTPADTSTVTGDSIAMDKAIKNE